MVPGWRWFQDGGGSKMAVVPGWGNTCRSEAEVYVEEAQVPLWYTHKHQVSKRQVSQRSVSKRLKRQVYKTSGL